MFPVYYNPPLHGNRWYMCTHKIGTLRQLRLTKRNVFVNSFCQDFSFLKNQINLTPHVFFSGSDCHYLGGICSMHH
jgi:hypothetical protein